MYAECSASFIYTFFYLDLLMTFIPLDLGLFPILLLSV